MPSSPTEKLLPSEGIHSVFEYRYSLVLSRVSPIRETVSVISDDTSAHILADPSFFRKKEIIPLSKGIAISKTGTIYRR